MIQINIVDTILGYINEYVKIAIYDENTNELLTYYDGRNSVDEKYLGCEVEDFTVDNGLVTIWINVE